MHMAEVWYIKDGFTNKANFPIDEIDKFLDERSGKDKYLDFWLDNKQLSIHPDWDKLRKMAKRSLIALKKQNMSLKVKIENKSLKSNDDNLIVQFVGMDTLEYFVQDNDRNGTQINLILQEFPTMLGGFISVQKKPSFFRKITRPFRKLFKKKKCEIN